MKRFTAILLAALMLFGSFTSVYAAKSDWMKVYEGLLKAYVTGAKGNATEYEEFALYDVDKDGTPELFLKEMGNNEDYQMYRFENDEATLVETFKAAGFYTRLDTGDFVIEVSNDDSTSYIVHEEGVLLKDSDYIVLQKERYRESVIEGWHWNYYYLGREISEEEYSYTMDQILTPCYLSFKEINEVNINLYIYEGKSFFAKESNPQLTIEKDGLNSQIIFPDGNEIQWKNNGDVEIYGLLAVNGTFINNVYPVLDGGRTLIPVRAVTETFGATVDWLPETSVVNIKGKNIDIVMTIGDNNAIVNGFPREMDIPAQIIDGSTYVPVRFVSENLNMEVYYQEATNDFPTVVSLEEQYFYGINTIEEREALGRVDQLIENIDWSAGSSFTATYMSNLLNIRSDGLKCGRFWATIVDADGVIRVWTDMYTGQIYTVVSNDSGLTIKTGDQVIEALSELYL